MGGHCKRVEQVVLLTEGITKQAGCKKKVRRPERYLVNVVEDASDIIVSMNQLGKIITWNRAGERITGFSALELMGCHITSICAPSYIESLLHGLQKAMKGEMVKNFEVEVISKRGKMIPFAWNFSSMKDENDRPVGVVGVGRDLTETKQLQTQLVQSAKLASLGVLAGGMAHELRNPLGIAAAASQMLLEKPHDTKLLKECAKRIHSNIARAAEIIEDLLQFARPSIKRGESVNVNKSLNDVLQEIKKRFAAQQVTLCKDLSTSLPAIRADGKLLKQVFLNIIANSCNAMPKGGLLYIKTELKGGEGAHFLEVSIRDNGVGMSKNYIDKLFDPFFTTMPLGKGTGLGLSICYGIIKGHGGEIKVESKENEGSTFTILLPVTTRRPKGPGSK